MLKCKYCGTETTKSGEKFINQGALNLHQSRCLDNPDKEKTDKKLKKNQNTSCPHEFIFLEDAIKRANDAGLKNALRMALAHGDNEVCMLCGEVK